ncbi:MAG TPA: ATP-dependent metallopeptidase FtsH/Yme1/Tma family protein, partial [Pyrinomonadaceae bacterium]|nr:ATP-dependent metallopeptidase FtsH/Yme1/Tma family protein [Pyrinomonadaceae bacterium]
MSSKAKQVLLWLMILAGAMVLVWALQSRQGKSATELSYDEALTRIRNKDVAEAQIKSDSLELVSKDREKFVTKLDASDATRTSLL